MRPLETPARFVQITGAVESIEELLSHWMLDGARRCNLHGQTWIEIPLVSDRQMELISMKGCQVHFTQSSPYSAAGWHEGVCARTAPPVGTLLQR